MPFRKAHEIVGELVLYCEKHGKGLEDLTLDEFRAASPLFGKDIVGELDPRAFIILGEASEVRGEGFVME